MSDHERRAIGKRNNPEPDFGNLRRVAREDRTGPSCWKPVEQRRQPEPFRGSRQEVSSGQTSSPLPGQRILYLRSFRESPGVLHESVKIRDTRQESDQRSARQHVSKKTPRDRKCRAGRRNISPGPPSAGNRKLLAVLPCQLSYKQLPCPLPQSSFTWKLSGISADRARSGQSCAHRGTHHGKACAPGCQRPPRPFQ